MERQKQNRVFNRRDLSQSLAVLQSQQGITTYPDPSTLAFLDWLLPYFSFFFFCAFWCAFFCSLNSKHFKSSVKRLAFLGGFPRLFGAKKARVGGSGLCFFLRKIASDCSGHATLTCAVAIEESPAVSVHSDPNRTKRWAALKGFQTMFSKWCFPNLSPWPSTEAMP